jgi:hypothetical protein
MPRAALLYETGLVLGYTFKDCLATFAQLFCESGREAGLIAILQRQAEERLTSLGGNVSNVGELYSRPEAIRLLSVLRQAGLTQASDWSEMHMIAEQPLRVTDFFQTLQFAPAEGIGFGSRFPDITLRVLSLGIPGTTLKPKSIERHQRAAFKLIRPYVRRVRPDLISTLSL